MKNQVIFMSGTDAFVGHQLTKEELEKVVSFHQKGLLDLCGKFMEFGYDPTVPGCIMQHLEGVPWPSVAFKCNEAVAFWFDQNYRKTWSDWMLREAMINAGLVE